MLETILQNFTSASLSFSFDIAKVVIIFRITKEIYDFNTFLTQMVSNVKSMLKSLKCLDNWDFLRTFAPTK